jgi:hypothetical protein
MGALGVGVGDVDVDVAGLFLDGLGQTAHGGRQRQQRHDESRQSFHWDFLVQEF